MEDCLVAPKTVQDLIQSSPPRTETHFSLQQKIANLRAAIAAHQAAAAHPANYLSSNATEQAKIKPELQQTRDALMEQLTQLGK